MNVYATYFYSPFSKKYEWSYISKDLEMCEARYKEKTDKGLILQKKKVYPRPVMTLEEIKKDFLVIKER